MRADGRLPGLPLGAGESGDAERREGGDDHHLPDAETAARFAASLRLPAGGDAVLSALGAGPAAAAPADPGPAAQVVEQLAQRLLVDADGGREVRVDAREEAGIPGLEVTVRRTPGGGLEVELMAPHPADQALLRGGAGELVRRLEARFGCRAEVLIHGGRSSPGAGGA